MPTTFVVTPDLEARPLLPVSDIERRFGKPAAKPEGLITKSKAMGEAYEPTENGFIWTVVEAYNQHHHLVIRPDDVWLAIGTQFAFFLQANAEELRPKFVDHEGKKELVARQVATLKTADYGKLAQDLAFEIGKNIHDKELKDWIVPAFSTTQDVDKVVGAMILMAAASKYFSYRMELCCGLPSVTLAGELQDWEEIERRAAKLLNYDTKSQVMTKWLKLLAPVLSQFTAAAAGKPDLQFWQRICSEHGNGSGPRYLSGWITVFSVFSDTGEWRGEQVRVPNNWEKGQPYANRPWPIMNTNDVAGGKISVDVQVDDGEKEYACELVAGHLHMIRAGPATLQPGIGWLIRHKVDQEKPKRRVFGEAW